MLGHPGLLLPMQQQNGMQLLLLPPLLLLLPPVVLQLLWAMHGSLGSSCSSRCGTSSAVTGRNRA
jgi:hypothetical protein